MQLLKKNKHPNNGFRCCMGHTVTGTIRTAVGVVGNSDDAHRLLGDVGAQHFHVPPGVLVRSQHGPPHPVRPEDVVPVHGQAERMHRLALQQDLERGEKRERRHSWASGVSRKRRRQEEGAWSHLRSGCCRRTRSARSCPAWRRRSRASRRGGRWPGRWGS